MWLYIHVHMYRRTNRISHAQNVAWLHATSLNAGLQEVVISNDNQVPIRMHNEVSLSIDDVQSPDYHRETKGWYSFLEFVSPWIHRINVPSAGDGMWHHYGSSITFKDVGRQCWDVCQESWHRFMKKSENSESCHCQRIKDSFRRIGGYDHKAYCKKLQDTVM